MLRRLAIATAVVLLPVGAVVAVAPGIASAAGSAPVVRHVAPRHGSSTGGTAVAVEGANFEGATAVDFGGKAARSYHVVSHKVIIAVSPSGTGTVDVTVTTPDGTSTTGSADQFIYSTRLPIVDQVVPRHGRPGGGTLVTVVGDYLNGATAVDFGTDPATDVTVYSSHLVTAKSPAGSGTVDVTVTTPLGTSATTPKDQYTYDTTAPVVTHVNPHRGSPNGGTAVTITGSHLSGATAVDFGTNPATDVTVVTSHLITATSPAGTGTVDVTVTTPDATSATDTGDQFTYTNVGPVVSHVAPRHGPAAGGTTVAVTGSNLTGTTVVDFGTNPASDVRVISGKVVLVKSPAGTGTVDVTVTTPLGTSATSSKDQFTYK